MWRVKFFLKCESIENIVRIVLHVDYDDAYVAYLNGTEIVSTWYANVYDLL